jgi:hypothetical protein
MRIGGVALVAAVAFAGCGKGEDEETNDVEEVAESAGARGLAEALRITLVTDDSHDDRRSVEALDEAVSDLPGSPEITGIEDDDGDGRDDDGEIVVHVDDEVACLTVAANGDEVDVTGGEC